MASDAVDRLNNLLNNFIDRILVYLPIHDIARTSVLSKTWRDIWRTHPVVVFNDDFFAKFVSCKVSRKDKLAQLSKALGTISDILLLHRGPILKFHLSIPPDSPSRQCLRTDFWIQYLSNNGIRDLEIFNKSLIPYRMPLYLFSCSGLSYLTLTNCILNPPSRFGGFYNLISVKLTNVLITAETSFGTKLEQLILERCTGIEHLGSLFIRDNNLGVLMITDSRELDWELFECSEKLKLTSLMLTGVANSKKKGINLEKLVSNMPRINSVLFDGHFCKFLEPGEAISERPITKMENLNSLSFEGVEFHDLVQIQYVLCLIGSSPNLQYLLIEQGPKVKSLDGMEEFLSIEPVLQSPNSIDMILYHLRTLEIRCIVGSRAELQFIQFLLASPSSFT
ncbi:hypothetical protein POM88_030701 [Heracleum sosnowskyi]|uniref:F-box domain-containing protein n=1 Tax=Heracleum sosnowskyi TaxID=360622 RepID=A0AAD8MJL8_9APIA|nr:hypothetical protein POM88_030701 [Heracleum sosnowskyi]